MKKNLFLMALIAMLAMVLGLGMIACSSGDDDDDDNDTADDDFDDDTTDDDDNDNDDNDDTTDDDDNDTTDDDDDSADYSCAQVADAFLNGCGFTLQDVDGNQADELGLTDWCTMSEALFEGGKTVAPAWQCIGECSIDQFCDETCFDGCLNPPAPASGCGVTVDAVYACNIVWLFDDMLHYILEMDMQAACELLTDWPWECIATCVDDSGADCDALLTCMNAC